jgi:hypothetical protein
MRQFTYIARPTTRQQTLFALFRNLAGGQTMLPAKLRQQKLGKFKNIIGSVA